MKKYIVFIFLCLLIGCTNQNIKVFVLDRKDTHVKVTLNVKGDKIISQETNSIMSLNSLGYNSEKEAKVHLESTKKNYQNIQGITYKYTIKDKRVEEYLSLDYQKINKQVYSELQLSSNDNQNISFKETKEYLLSKGYTMKNN